VTLSHAITRGNGAVARWRGILAAVLLGSHDPAATWRYAERYLGGGTRTYSPFSADLEISPEFHPVHGAPRFTVPTFWVEAGADGWLTNRIASPLPAIYRDGDAMLLPVHPETLTVPDLYRGEQLRRSRPGPPLEVAPSANARTVFAERLGGVAVAPHFLKLHYPKRLSRFTRRLRRPVIALQLWVADELFHIGAPFLPEVAGGAIGDDPAQAWGYLLREPAVRDGGSPPFIVPLFALYGRDLRAPADPTLLEQLVVHSGEEPEVWVTRRVIEPIVTLWCEVLLRTGCAIEPHGQNTLFRFSPDGRDTRIAYRDCAVYVDPAIRAECGLAGSLPPRNVISRDVDQPRAQVLSLVYDSFLGSHALAFVARLLEHRFGVHPGTLHRSARKAFAAAAGARELMPETVYYYDDQLHEDGQWRLVDTGAAPTWR
jgi:hypothetical protein